MGRQTPYHIGITDHFNAVVCGNNLIFDCVFTVAAIRCRQIDNHTARFHAIYHLFGDKLWCRFSWNQRGSNNDIDIFRLSGVKFSRFTVEFIRHLFSITIA
ncbi:Uncharacterised protein [Vibrio cholerae]|nr:Uncharacterised protein [Vibrio cholerae]CSD17648.1 Uncharacterised protein [Vibrio cholerae]